MNNKQFLLFIAATLSTFALQAMYTARKKIPFRGFSPSPYSTQEKDVASNIVEDCKKDLRQMRLLLKDPDWLVGFRISTVANAYYASGGPDVFPPELVKYVKEALEKIKKRENLEYWEKQSREILGFSAGLVKDHATKVSMLAYKDVRRIEDDMRLKTAVSLAKTTQNKRVDKRKKREWFLTEMPLAKNLSYRGKTFEDRRAPQRSRISKIRLLSDKLSYK